MISAMTGGIFSYLLYVIVYHSKVSKSSTWRYKESKVGRSLKYYVYTNLNWKDWNITGNDFTRRYSQCKWVLADLVRDCNRLHTLDISCNCIDDSTLEALIPSLGKLRRLDLSLNGSLGLLTTKAFQSLATLLEEMHQV